MQSESKWKRRRVQNDKYDEDDTVGMEREDSPLKNILIASAVAAGGIAAYKHGLFKYGIKSLLEQADNYKGYTHSALSAMKDWTRNAEEGVGNSIFRRGLSFRRLTNPMAMSKAFDETVSDVENLAIRVGKRVENAAEQAHDLDKRIYSNTDLAYRIGAMEKIHTGLNTTGTGKAANTINSAIINDMIKDLTISAEDAEKQIKRTGYKTATLGDLLHVDKNGTVLAKTSKINLEDEDGTRSRIEKLLKAVYSDENGEQHTLISSNKYKDMILDKNIMIDETGKLIDTRKTNNSMKGFVNSLSNDFQIPFIGLNPLRLFDLDNVGRETVKYGLLHSDTVQPYLSNKLGVLNNTVKDTFGDKPLVFVNGNIFKMNDEMSDLEKIAEGFHVWNVPKSLDYSYKLPREVNELRIMANMNLVDYEKYDANDPVHKQIYGKIMETLDLGFQDKRIKDIFKNEHDILEYMNPNYYVEAIASKLGKENIFKASKAVDAHDLGSLFGHAPEGEDVLFAVKDGYNFLDAVDGSKGYDISDWGHQFFAGREFNEAGEKVIGDNVTAKTSFAYFMFDRIDQGFAMFGLGLSNENKNSAMGIAGNLILRRFLPVYGAYKAYQYINYLTEDDDEDGNGNRDNIAKKVARGIVRTDLGWHSVKDALGITSVAKELAPLMPGAEQIGDIPGISALDLASTTEERQEYYESGMDPVRKGRYWDLGNTPFTGGKVEYWQPNWYRRVMADVDFSDSKYGSRQEYFQNAWFPTPTAPLAPLRHFIFDKYHYDMKHYYDRPYMMSSSEGENIPFIGPLFGETIGRLLKPRMEMHQEYWIKNGAADYNLGKARQISSSGSESSGSTVASGQGDVDLGVASEATDTETNKDTNYEIYETPSGTPQVVNIDDNMSIGEVNKQLKEYSAKKVLGENNEGISMRADSSQVAVRKAPEDKELLTANNLNYALGEQFNQWSEVAGIYGFTVQGFMTGESNTDKKVMETSGWAYSVNRQFWDQNVGGLGGELSELFRRFIPKRRKDVEYYNPIRNTMPEWMPGDDYFTDFQHGDPYTKVAKGEMRLPGQGYERMWGIEDPMALKIGSSFIGKSKTDIVKHFLKLDTIVDDDAQDDVDSGSELHKKIEREWLKSGLAIDTEGKVEDKANGILGFYDAIIHDESSKTGQAVVDIKTVSEKSFEKIKKEGVPKDHHQKQVNYYLWATGNEDSKGYVFYVNRDNPEETMTMGFNYSKEMLDETFTTLGAAREYVRQSIAEGTIQRGDMYSPIDKMRILADVAPYSKEFQEASAIVGRMKLNTKRKEEVSAINERVREQKQAMRIYPYRFKTANLEYEDVHVTEVLDNNTFLTEEHPDNPIRLAGVHVSQDEASGGKEAAANELKHYIRKGATVKIGIDPDPVNQKAKDTMNTIHAVVYKGNTNVNRRLLKMGLATEKKDDYSPTGVHARFTNTEIAFGSIWENIAHFNSTINTKLLQVRSAAENYERREVYGKNYQSWTHPIRDFLIPAINENIERPSGLLWGTLLGAAFGRGKYGRLMGATAGFTVTALGKMYVGAHEAKTGEKWIPKTRQKERNLTEYIDVLKFVKNRRLYEQYAEKALKENHFNVKDFMAKEKKNGDYRKKRMDELGEFKKHIKLHYKDRKDFEFATGKPKYVDMSADLKTMVSQINKEMKELQNTRKAMRLPDNATKAIEYYTKSEQTMYGYDPGESVMNIMKALPKKDRDYMKYFMDAPEEERPKILELAPKYMRRALESTWGMPIEDKDTLQAYFERHQLPGSEWKGWQEDVGLESVKVKMIKKQNLDFSEFNVWQDQIDQANAAGKVPLPRINHRSNAQETRAKLIDMLGNIGLHDIEIEYTNASKDIGMDVQIHKDKRKEIEEKIRTSRLV